MAYLQTAASQGAITGTTLDTGQGANELYDMDQNMLTTSDVVFSYGRFSTQGSATASGKQVQYGGYNADFAWYFAWPNPSANYSQIHNTTGASLGQRCYVSFSSDYGNANSIGMTVVYQIYGANGGSIYKANATTIYSSGMGQFAYSGFAWSSTQSRHNFTITNSTNAGNPMWIAMSSMGGPHGAAEYTLDANHN